jgi:glycosyltransferase involved in cell wall biosynthesis
VLQLLKDAKLLDTLGRQGREAVTFQYNRQKLAEKYLDILIQTTKR